MKSKLLQLRKVLLVAVGLLVGASAWAQETEWQIVWQTDFSSAPTGMTYSVTGGNTNISTGVLDYELPNGVNSRAMNTEFTATAFKVDTNWKMEFDWGAASSNTDASGVTFATNEGSAFKIEWASYATSATITDASGNSLTTDLTIDGYTKAIATKLSHFTIIGDTENGISLTVTYGNSTLIDNVIVSSTFGYPSTFNGTLGRYLSRMALDNIVFQTPKVTGFVAAPTFIVTGASGITRTLTLETITDGATILWSETAPTENETYAGWTEYATSLTTSASTIYAVAKENGNYSEVTTIETGAGVEIALNQATFSLLYFDAANNAYSIKVNSDQSDLIGTPTATLKYYTTDASSAVEVTAGSFITGIESGANLYVIASAEGYTSSTAEYTIPSTRGADGYVASWSDDFTIGGTLTNNGSFSVANVSYEIITKNGDTDLSGNVGLYAYNTTRWSSTTDGLKDNGSYYLGTQNVSTSGYVKITIDENSFMNSLISGRANINSSYAVKNEDGTFSIIYKPNNSPCSWNGYSGLLIKSISYLVELPEAITATIGSTGYATFASDYALDFENATGVIAYYATGAADGKVTMKKVEGTVAAGEGLFLQKDGDEAISIPVVAEGEELDNLLVRGTGGEVAAEEGYQRYVLGAEGESVAFYLIGETPATVAKDKAYLEVEAEAGARLSIVFDGETTGINEAVVNGAQQAVGTYNLNGQRVAQPTKGLYIVNGKKVIIK